MEHPLLLLALTAAGLYVGWQWWTDFRTTRHGHDGPTLPGATPASWTSVVIASAGALALVAGETWGEVTLGIAAQQSRMSWLFAVYSIAAAPIIEEIIFRGHVVIEHRGRVVMWTGVVAASLLFAVLHPFLWRLEGTTLTLSIDTKGWFSTASVFATSLWFYVARLAPWNRRRSLLPCFAAHTARNAAVVAIKAATGFLGA